MGIDPKLENVLTLIKASLYKLVLSQLTRWFELEQVQVKDALFRGGQLVDPEFDKPYVTLGVKRVICFKPYCGSFKKELDSILEELKRKLFQIGAREKGRLLLLSSSNFILQKDGNKLNMELWIECLPA